VRISSRFSSMHGDASYFEIGRVRERCFYLQLASRDRDRAEHPSEDSAKHRKDNLILAKAARFPIRCSRAPAWVYWFFFVFFVYYASVLAWLILCRCRCKCAAIAAHPPRARAPSTRFRQSRPRSATTGRVSPADPSRVSKCERFTGLHVIAVISRS